MGCSPSSEATVADGELVKVVVLHRHGARGPSAGALKPFKTDTNINKENSCLTEWAESELEVLNETGIALMKTFGSWFATEYFGSLHKGFLQKDEASFKWRSSKSDRARESGQLFWEGFGTAFGPLPSKPTPNSENADEDLYFRVYTVNEDYLKKIKELKKGDAFTEKGTQEEKFFDSVYPKVGIDPSILSPAEKLSNMTYLKELIDCEEFEGKKKAIISVVSDEDKKKTDELAHWVWGKRFFMPEFGKTLGGTLLAEIVQDLASDSSKFSLYSAHDYTILSVLAALGADDYPAGPCLGYACSLLFEVYKDKAGKKTVRLVLNGTPFCDKKGEPVKEYQNRLTPVTLSPFDSHGTCSLEQFEQSISGASEAKAKTASQS